MGNRDNGNKEHGLETNEKKRQVSSPDKTNPDDS